MGQTNPAVTHTVVPPVDQVVKMLRVRALRAHIIIGNRVCALGEEVECDSVVATRKALDGVVDVLDDHGNPVELEPADDSEKGG